MFGNCWVCGKKIIDPYRKKVDLRKYRTCSANCHHKLLFECLPLNEIEKRSQMKCKVCGKPAVFAKNVSRSYYCSEECRRIAFAPIKAWNDAFEQWIQEQYKSYENQDSPVTEAQQLSLF